jgi:hypothetical protein
MMLEDREDHIPIFPSHVTPRRDKMLELVETMRAMADGLRPTASKSRRHNRRFLTRAAAMRRRASGDVLSWVAGYALFTRKADSG